VRRRKSEEGGYALLFVLLTAAVIAISLYKQLPRVAFDTQRQKEQMLIERGEQYKRAIQIFLRASNNTRWPATLDELEDFNGKRFLRHRYKDPLTGKDEWRLVHIANGVLTDSILNKPKQPADQTNATDQSQYLTELASIGSQPNQDNGQQQSLSAATRRRASEGGVQPGPDGQPLPAAGMQPGAPGDPNAPGASNPTASGNPFPPGTPGGVPGVPAPGLPGQMPGGQSSFGTGSASNQSGTSSGSSSGSNSSSGSGYMSSLPSMGSSASSSTNGGGNGSAADGTGAPVNSQVGGVSPYSTAAGANGSAPGYAQPGTNITPQAQSAAAGLIGALLTQPRPGGLSGLPQQTQGQVIGGGIAGVASKGKGKSIMVYADHSDYSEWEFNWDPTKWAPPPNPNQSTVGTPMSQVASNAGSGATANGTTPNGFSANAAMPNGSAIGAANGTGTGSSFGNGGFGNSGSGNSSFGSGGSFGGSTTGNGTTAGGATPAATGSQPSMGGFGAGGLPPSLRPGAP
jgi:uncharacterized membrane protein YgcG